MIFFHLLFLIQNHDFRYGFKISPLLCLPSPHSVSCLSGVPKETGALDPTINKNKNEVVHVYLIPTHIIPLRAQYMYESGD